MIKTCGQLRDEMDEAENSMEVLVQVPGVSYFMRIKNVAWIEGRCVLCVSEPLSIVTGPKKEK